jgi:hypothetical protein
MTEQIKITERRLIHDGNNCVTANCVLRNRNQYDLGLATALSVGAVGTAAPDASLPPTGATPAVVNATRHQFQEVKNETVVL